MSHARTIGSIIAVALFTTQPVAAADQRVAANHGGMQPQSVAANQPAQVEMPAAGKKVALPGDRYFIWEFDQKPAMGTVVFKVKVFDKAGVQQSTLKMIGEADMPSMRGHHSSGPVEFKLNKKGDYLLPVNLVMRGEWEVAVTLLQDNQPIYQGFTRFRI